MGGYYTYKVTFKDLPGYFYYGRRKDNGKPYFGSPVAWKSIWDQFEPEIQILQRYSTFEEAERAEYSLIEHTWKDKYSLNENLGGYFSEEACRKGGIKNNGKLQSHPNTEKSRKENLLKMHAHPNTVEAIKKNLSVHRSEHGKKNGKRNSKIMTAKVWKCLVTGHVSNAGGLTAYQNKRGIDTSLRVKVNDN